MPEELLQVLYGAKENLPQSDFQRGRLLLTVEQDSDGSEPEARIYFDNGEKLIQLYENVLSAFLEETKGLELIDNKLEIKLSKKENNSLSIQEDGLFGEKPDAGFESTYVLTQNMIEVGRVNIPKDKFVEDSSIVEIKDYPNSGEEDTRDGVDSNGNYLKLTIAGKDSYVSLKAVTDLYVGSTGNEINVAVGGDNNRTISASLQDLSIQNEKIKDETLTEKKLSPELQEKVQGLKWGDFKDLVS